MHGLRSPVPTSWDTLFADVHLTAGTRLPLDAEHEERAIYILAGEIEIGGDRHGPEHQAFGWRQSKRRSVGTKTEEEFGLVICIS